VNPNFRKHTDDLLPAGDGSVDREAVNALVQPSARTTITLHLREVRYLLDHPLDLVLRLDGADTILEANDSTCEKLGIEQSDLVGKNVASLRPLRRFLTEQPGDAPWAMAVLLGMALVAQRVALRWIALAALASASASRATSYSTGNGLWQPGQTDSED